MTSRTRILSASFAAASLLAACGEGPTSPSSSLEARSTTSAAKGGGVISVGTIPAPQPPGPLSGSWFGTLANPSPLATPYQVSLIIVQNGTGISGTFDMFSPGERIPTQDAVGGIANGRVSLTLRSQKGRPSAQATTYSGTISADSSTMTLTSAIGTVLVLSH